MYPVLLHHDNGVGWPAHLYSYCVANQARSVAVEKDRYS